MGGYSFEGRRGFDAPRLQEYTFYIAAKDNSGNYSDYTEITVQHPGIQQLILEEQDVEGLLSTIKIKLPKVYSEVSQRVYPEDNSSEEKEIIAYRVHLQKIKEDAEEPISEDDYIGEEEIIDIDTENLEHRTVFMQVEQGARYLVKIGAYDSVYNPKFNPDLYEQTISDSQTVQTLDADFPEVYDALIEPNELTEAIQNYEEGLEEQLTIKAGTIKDGEEIVGGIGLAYNEELNDIEVQILADRFRLFDTDVAPDGRAPFAVGEVDGEARIFMSANQIALIGENSEFEDSNFFVLDDDGLKIWTPDFQLRKDGSAEFSGEVQAEVFTLSSENFQVDTNGINVGLDTEFTFNSNTGDAEFSGTLKYGEVIDKSVADQNLPEPEIKSYKGVVSGLIIELEHPSNMQNEPDVGGWRTWDGFEVHIAQNSDPGGEYYDSDGPDYTPNDNSLASAGKQTRFEITGLLPDTEYYVKVIMVDINQNKSAPAY